MNELEEDDATTVRRATELLDATDKEQEDTGNINGLSQLAWVNTFARVLLRLARKAVPLADPGPDGHLWQLWEYGGGEIRLQRRCDAKGCDKGLLYTPVRNCSRCQGSGFLTRMFKLGNEGV